MQNQFRSEVVPVVLAVLQCRDHFISVIHPREESKVCWPRCVLAFVCLSVCVCVCVHTYVYGMCVVVGVWACEQLPCPLSQQQEETEVKIKQRDGTVRKVCVCYSIQLC